MMCREFKLCGHHIITLSYKYNYTRQRYTDITHAKNARGPRIRDNHVQIFKTSANFLNLGLSLKHKYSFTMMI